MVRTLQDSPGPGKGFAPQAVSTSSTAPQHRTHRHLPGGPRPARHRRQGPTLCPVGRVVQPFRRFRRASRGRRGPERPGTAPPVRAERWRRIFGGGSVGETAHRRLSCPATRTNGLALTRGDGALRTARRGCGAGTRRAHQVVDGLPRAPRTPQTGRTAADATAPVPRPSRRDAGRSLHHRTGAHAAAVRALPARADGHPSSGSVGGGRGRCVRWLTGVTRDRTRLGVCEVRNSIMELITELIEELIRDSARIWGQETDRGLDEGDRGEVPGEAVTDLFCAQVDRRSGRDAHEVGVGQTLTHRRQAYEHRGAPADAPQEVGVPGTAVPVRGGAWARQDRCRRGRGPEVREAIRLRPGRRRGVPLPATGPSGPGRRRPGCAGRRPVGPPRRRRAGRRPRCGRRR